MADGNRRRSGRLVCAGLVSDFGVVSDLSAGGCRVTCKRLAPLALGSGHSLTLRGEGLVVVVQGKIVRRTRLGLRRWEYGVEFVGLNNEQKWSIGQLSKTTAVNRLLPTVDEAASRAAA